MWSISAILKRERTHPGGNHVTDGKVLGSLKRGVSIDWSPGNIYLHVGNLSGPPRERHSFVLDPKAARSLAYDLLLAAAELDVALERERESARTRQREEKASARKRARATTSN